MSLISSSDNKYINKYVKCYQIVTCTAFMLNTLYVHHVSQTHLSSYFQRYMERVMRQMIIHWPIYSLALVWRKRIHLKVLKMSLFLIIILNPHEWNGLSSIHWWYNYHNRNEVFRLFLVSFSSGWCGCKKSLGIDWCRIFRGKTSSVSVFRRKEKFFISSAISTETSRFRLNSFL